MHDTGIHRLLWSIAAAFATLGVVVLAHSAIKADPFAAGLARSLLFGAAIPTASSIILWIAGAVTQAYQDWEPS